MSTIKVVVLDMIVCKEATKPNSAIMYNRLGFECGSRVMITAPLVLRVRC